MAQTRMLLSEMTEASQDPSRAIATPPTWTLWPFRMAWGVPSEVSRWTRLWCAGVSASSEVVGQALSTQVSAPVKLPLARRHG
jgi:hypothetical protein